MSFLGIVKKKIAERRAILARRSLNVQGEIPRLEGPMRNPRCTRTRKNPKRLALTGVTEVACLRIFCYREKEIAAAYSTNHSDQIY